MLVSELNLAVDELVGPFERNHLLLLQKSIKISNYTCGQHVSHVFKMSLHIIDEIISYTNLKSDITVNPAHTTNRASLFWRSFISRDQNDRMLKFNPDNPLIIDDHWLKKTYMEWENKINIINHSHSTWKKEILPLHDSILGYMTGENWIRYLIIYTYRQISLINRILSVAKKNQSLLMDFPTEYEDLLKLNPFCLN